MRPNLPKLPNQFKVSFEQFHKLSFMARLRLIVGWNVLCETRVLVDKRSGRTRGGTKLMLTNAKDEQTAADQHRKQFPATDEKIHTDPHVQRHGPGHAARPENPNPKGS